MVIGADTKDGCVAGMYVCGCSNHPFCRAHIGWCATQGIAKWKLNYMYAYLFHVLF